MSTGATIRLSCSGGYPCSECYRNKIKCSYPDRSFSSQLDWTTVDPSRVERFGESLDLSLGVAGAARLQQKRSGDESYFEWQLAVSQDEGRLHEHGGELMTDI